MQLFDVNSYWSLLHCTALRSVHTQRYLPCDAVRYRNQVKFYSTAIAARLRRCVNAALQHIPTHAAAAVACSNPALTQRDL